VEKIKIFIIAVLLALAAAPLHAGLKGKIDSGNGMFRKGNFEGALSKYQDAQIDDPENPVLHFNCGDALYKSEKYEEAAKEFEKASYSKDIEMQAKSYYNIGNSLFKAEKLPEAIQYYQKCLELNPKDNDAKYNLEFTRKKIKENIDKNKQQGQDNKQDKQKQQQDKQNKDGKNGKDKKEQKAQQAQKAKEEKGKEGQKDKGQEEKKPKMSKEDAERILKAVNEDEKKALDKKKQQQMKGYNWGGVKEDW